MRSIILFAGNTKKGLYTTNVVEIEGNSTLRDFSTASSAMSVEVTRDQTIEWTFFCVFFFLNCGSLFCLVDFFVANFKY